MTTTTTKQLPSINVHSDVLAVVAWSAGAALLFWLAALHLGVVLAFATGASVSPALAPLATAAALAAAWGIARQQALPRAQSAAAVAATAVVIAAGLALASAFYDLTWDGQWYHQTAVYEMADGWNPLRDPVHEFGRHTWNLWVLHYAKGPWFVALALFRSTGSIELAKAASVITPAIALLVVMAVAIDTGLQRRWAALVAVTAALNPVTTCGMLTHQVDGILVSLMACSVAAGIAYLRRPAWLSAFVVFVSAALCINTKFTGLVYVCFFFLAGALYCLWRRRDLLVRFVTLTGATLVAGILVFGFNPYVTNTMQRGHLFYPVQGTAAYPGLAQQGKDPIELYETPRNMMGRSRFLRLAYGVFGKPGTAPYVTKDAEFMWPFVFAPRDFGLYYFHDVRIGGFGPLFSGVLLLAAALAAVGCARRVLPGAAIVLIGGGIVASLLVSTHTWWARYGPHLWWLPLVPIAAALGIRGRSAWKGAAASLAALLLIDALVIGAVHLRWEWRSTQALEQQLADLKTVGPITVDLAYFDVPVARRFRSTGVTFETTRRFECAPGQRLTLMSVCHGYPEWVRVCVADQAQATRLQALPHWQWSAEP